MTRNEKATIIGNAHLDLDEAKQNLNLLKAKASQYADHLKKAVYALENNLACQYKDGKLSYGKKDGSVNRFGDFQEYPTALEVSEVLGEIQVQAEAFDKASKTLDGVG